MATNNVGGTCAFEKSTGPNGIFYPLFKEKQIGHTSIVYGHITGMTWRSEDYHKLQRLNKNIIESLSISDDIFPWITRNMFLVPDPYKDKMYRDQVIFFGASYKSVEHEWHDWLDKFEQILKQLYWSSVVIHLETELVGDHKYEWLSDPDLMDNLLSQCPEPISKWRFTGGPRKFFDKGVRRD